jgi:hypothetical protein
MAQTYLRTSSAANVGADKDSDKRQRAAIEAYARHAGFELVGEYFDAAVSGADPVDTRPGFRELLERIVTRWRPHGDRGGCEPFRGTVMTQEASNCHPGRPWRSRADGPRRRSDRER